MTALWILVGLAVLVVVASQRAVARRQGRQAVKAYHHSLDTLDHITTHTRERAAPHPMQVQAHVRLVRDRTGDAGSDAPPDHLVPAPAEPSAGSTPDVPLADARRARRRSKSRSRARRVALITAVAAVIVVAALLAVAAWGGYAAPRL